MPARIVMQRTITIPCGLVPLAACGRMEIGAVSTTSGSYRIRFRTRFSDTPALVVTGVGVWELNIAWTTIRLPVPIIVYRVTREYFDYWLPAGEAYFSYIAVE